MINKVILLGRIVRDPEVRYTQGENPVCICRYTIAVPRKYHREGEQEADFINCVAFGKNAEFAEKFFVKGKRYCVSGRLQTGSYENRDGQTVYYTEVVVEDQDFADSSDNSGNASSGNAGGGTQQRSGGSGNQRQGQGNGQRSGGNRASGSRQQAQQPPQQPAGDGFMNIPDGINEELPFN